MPIALMFWLLLMPPAQEREEKLFPAHVDNRAPAFSLYDLEGALRHSRTFEGSAGLLFLFTTVDEARGAVAKLQCRYAKRKVTIVVVDVTPREPVSILRARYTKLKLGVPVLFDDEDVVADRYQITATPHAYLLDQRGVIRYHGDARKPLRRALDQLLAGKEVTVKETPVVERVPPRPKS